MPGQSARAFTLANIPDLELETIGNGAGLRAHRFASGQMFCIEHVDQQRRLMINQVLGSSTGGHMNRLILRLADPNVSVSLLEAGAFTHIGSSSTALCWRGACEGLRWDVTLSMQPDALAWSWDVRLWNPEGCRERPFDLVFVQDIGLAGRDFLMTNEAYASQYLDHTSLVDPELGHVLATRQNLDQEGRHPFVMHGCLDGAVSFATDLEQILGPAHRVDQRLAQSFGQDLPGRRKQRESACAALQSKAVVLPAGARARMTFFGLLVPDHPDATSTQDLAQLARLARPDITVPETSFRAPLSSIVDTAGVLCGQALSPSEIQLLYPERTLEEFEAGALLSFFTPSPTGSAHVVLLEKERHVPRRHGAILRSGDGVMPNESTLCVTAWMQGIFASQLTIGNTVFHQVFSASREPYGLLRDGGLRIFIDMGKGWRQLGVPSAFHMEPGLCRWIYVFDARQVVIDLIVSGLEPAARWSVKVAGAPCRFLAVGQLVLGEREHEAAGRMEIDAHGARVTFRPDPQSIWGKAHPQAVLTLVTGTPGAIEAMGSDELLYPDGHVAPSGHIVVRTGCVQAFNLSISGSLTHPGDAERLAARHAGMITEAKL